MYDSLGQLKTETDTLNGGATNYTYDVYGNRTSMTVTGANPSQTSYVYDANNRMTRQTKAVGDVQTIADYTYDNNGNMVSKLMSEIAPETEENPTLSIEETETTDVADSLDGAEAIFYTYNLLNHLTNITADNGVNISYAYDIQNKRVGKTVNDAYTRYVWNGDNIVYESGTTEIRYSYGNGLESITNGTTEHYYLKNGHGDITQLTDSTGTVAEDYTYDAFGNQLSDTPTVYNPFRYSGEYFDQETGLTYLRARYYDPSIGRFISEDPIKDGVNWYVYCGSDPVNFVDPSGLKPGDIFSSAEEAAIDFGLYIGQQSIENEEEYASYIYMTKDRQGNEYYSYDTPRNNLKTHQEREISFSISYSFGKTPYAVIHSHGAYDVETENTKDAFSSPGNVANGVDDFSDTAQSDLSGFDYYVVTPAGNLKKYEANSGNYDGKLISSDMPVDPKIEVHQRVKNTLLWNILKNVYTKATDEDIVNARYNHPDSISDTIDELERLR